MEIVYGPDNMQPYGLMHNGTSLAIQGMRSCLVILSFLPGKVDSAL